MCTMVNHVHYVLCVLMIYHSTHKHMFFSKHQSQGIREIFIPHQICQNMLLPAWNEEQATASWTRMVSPSDLQDGKTHTSIQSERMSVWIWDQAQCFNHLSPAWEVHRTKQACANTGRALGFYKISALLLLLLLVAANRFNFAPLRRFSILWVDVPQYKNRITNDPWHAKSTVTTETYKLSAY